MPIRLTITSLLERNLAARPDQVAFVEGGREITYAEFDLLCRKAAAWLADQGIGPGDLVAVWLVNRVEWLALFFGAARIGAGLVAVNTRYRASELEYLLGRSKARMLVLQLNFRKIDFPAILEGVDPSKVPSLERVAVIDAGNDMPAFVLGKPTTAFDLSRQSVVAVQDRSDPDALMILFTTSGTTKGPKLVMHPQRTLALHSSRAARAYGLDQAGARLLGALPLCGVFGLNAVLAAFVAGTPVFMMETFDGAAAADLIRRHSLTHIFASDEVYERILAHAPGHDPLPSLRVCGYGSFKYGAEEFAVPARERGMPLVGLYGSSEVQALFSMQPATLPAEQLIEGGGRPAAGMAAQVRIRDIETGELLMPGSSGEVEIRADTNFIGYFNDPEATANAVHPDGFFCTGDIGRLREDGTFVYETRRGDAIRLGGFLVSPAEVEEALKRLPGVAAAQVVAVSIGGQARCVAWVVPAPESALTEKDVIAGAAAGMAPFKVPARVWFIDEFPTTQSSNGVKIQRAKLRDMALERIAAEG